jgi:hypothetical protein
MSLQELLTENKLKIVSTWIDKVMSTYSPDGARFFKGQKDRFANPLGYSVEKGLESLFNDILAGGEIDGLPGELLQFVKLRAVQDMAPSTALAFLYELKDVVREVCGTEVLSSMAVEWARLDRVVDQVALLGFDVYVKDRELLNQVKIQEMKRGNNVMLEGGLRCPSSMMRGNKEAKKELQVIKDC